MEHSYMAPFKMPACLINLGHDQNFPAKTLSHKCGTILRPLKEGWGLEKKKVISLFFFSIHLSPQPG
jgi:hypothetical protein